LNKVVDLGCEVVISGTHYGDLGLKSSGSSDLALVRAADSNGSDRVEGRGTSELDFTNRATSLRASHVLSPQRYRIGATLCNEKEPGTHL